MTVSVSVCGSPEWATIRPPSSEYQESEATVPRTNTAWTVQQAASTKTTKTFR